MSPVTAVQKERERLLRMDAEAEARYLKHTTLAAVEKVRREPVLVGKWLSQTCSRMRTHAHLRVLWAVCGLGIDFVHRSWRPPAR